MVINQNKFLLTSLTRACKIKNDKVKTTLPIRKGLMRLLINTVPFLFRTPQPFLTIMYRAMLCTTYYGLFRIGEIAWTDYSDHTVKVKDVHIGENKNKIMFVLHSSKTHGCDSKPQIIKLTSDLHQGCAQTNLFSIAHCPFELLRRYMRIRKQYATDQEPFFVFRDRTPVKAAQFRRILKQLLLLNHLNPNYYSCQSIRTGRVMDLAEFLSIESVRKIGRWKSSVIYTYLRA